jgi:hypothetical protein
MKPITKAFVEGDLVCIDGVDPETGRSLIAGETLKEIRIRYPKARIVELGPWIAAKELRLCTDAERISRERFIECLEVLPPRNVQFGRHCLSFELTEHLSGRVTSICVQYGNHYFAFNGITGQSLAENLKHCGVA